MKNIKIVLSSLFLFSIIISCSKESSLELNVDALVEEIAFADSKVAIEPSELPTEATQFIEEEYFETFIDRAFRVPNRGFQVRLGNEDVLFFDTRGRDLRPDRDPFGTSPCGRGVKVLPADLPAAILAYIADNYPDAEIFRAKKKPHGYLVKISDGLILIFNNDEEFVQATTHFFHCHPLGVRIGLDELPTSIVNYVNDHYSNPEIKIAFEKTNGNFIIGITTDDGRKILGFDAAGNFLFERP